MTELHYEEHGEKSPAPDGGSAQSDGQSQLHVEAYRMGAVLRTLTRYPQKVSQPAQSR